MKIVLPMPPSSNRMKGTEMTRPTDEQMLASYAVYKNVWRVGEALGIAGQTVHKRLAKLKAIDINSWTADDYKILSEKYSDYRAVGRLDDLAALMGRSKTSICNYAKKLGLTNQSLPRHYTRKWKGMTVEHAAVIFEAFKESRLGLGAYCQKKGFDDLGFSRAMKGHFPDEWEAVIELKAPKQSWYRLGRSVEYRVRDDLKKRGYFALRSPGSKSPLDIMATKPGVVLFVQCKRSLTCNATDWNSVYDLAIGVAAIPLLAGSPMGRGLVYKRIIDRKDGSKRRQPYEDFEP